MLSALPRRLIMLALLSLAAGCGSAPGPDEKTNPDPNAADRSKESTPTSAQGLFITGKVTLPDGKTPPTGDVKDIRLNIFGISEAGEKITYTPIVKPDGTYRQKVVPGQYTFDYGTITLLHRGMTEFTLQLEPVGPNWNKRRDAADAIVQDFLWRPTGPSQYGRSNGLDSRNHTHWHGISIGMDWQGFRSDLMKAVMPPPDGTRFVFTLTPTEPALDGTKPEPFTRELTYDGKNTNATGHLHDLPPTSYEVTGVAHFADGTTKPLVFTGVEYGRYVNKLSVPLERDKGSSSGYFKLLAGFGLEGG